MKLRALLAALALTVSVARADDTDVPKVAGWLAGTFTAPGAELPKGAGPTRIVSALVPKSRIGLGAPVLYVETAASATPDRPYRQQFLRVEDAGPGRVVVKVFEPKDRIGVSGKWRDVTDLALFGERDVAERKPCQLTLSREGETYVGSTIGTGCATSLAGARYVTSRMVVAADRLQIASSGFDSAGKRVWGGEELVFKRDAVSVVPAPGAAVAAAPSAAPARAAAPPAPIAAVPAPAAAPRPAAAAPPAPAAASAANVPGGPAELVVRGARLNRKLSLDDLKRLPAAERRDGARLRGASLKDVLAAAGVDVSEKNRASLATTVLLAYGADDETAAVAGDEAFSASSPIVAWEADGRPLAPGDGPLRLVVPGSGPRSIRKLMLLEIRELSGGAPLGR